MKETKRMAFNFLRSYFDVLNMIEKDEDKLSFLLSVIDKQFLDLDPNGLSFISKLSYESQRHAVEKSVNGWKTANKTDLQGNPIPPLGGSPMPLIPPPPKEEEEQGQEEGQEEVKDIKKPLVAPTEKIDFKVLLEFIIETTGKKFRVINDATKKSFNARLKDGYTKTDIKNAIINACKDEYHKENGFKYLKPEYFSRANTLDLHAFKKQKDKSVTFKNPYPEHNHKS